MTLLTDLRRRIHVVSVDLTATPDLTLLAPDEMARHQRFRHADSRRRYAVCRGELRRHLAAYQGCAPADLRLGYGPHGKPHLVAPEPRLRFNVSHSADVALLAFAWEREVGVDIEAVRPLDPTAIAHRYFSAREAEELLALPEGERLAGFFNGWARKEAFIKARGEGLAHPLHGFSVSLAPGRPAALLHHDDPAELQRWRLATLPAPEGFSAALVAEAGHWCVGVIPPAHP